MATSSQLPAAARIAARRVQRRLRHLRRRALSVAVITCAVAGALGSAARVDAAQHHGRRHAMRSASSAPALAFGIYPGGGAGSVDAAGPMHPEDPAQRLSALQQLRPARRPFVLRLYASYTGGSGSSAEAQVGQDLAQYTASGFRVEVVLCYRPSDGKRSVDVAGFVEFVQAAVEQLGPNHGVVALQVSNEANVSGAPNAADGYYAGASDALIAGVEAAKATIAHDGFSQLKVGFSWAYQLDSAEKSFWSYLGQRGGVAFRRALDWVGIASLRRARTVDQIREWAGLYAVVRGLGGASVAALLVFGLYMTAVTWGPTGWIAIGFRRCR